MGKVTSLFFILLVVLSACALKVMSQEKSFITVQGNTLSNGLLVLNVVKDGKGYKLTCNQDMASCTALKNGRYQLVQLPKNFGTYECQDVQIYSESTADTDKEGKLGEYCLE